MVEPSNGMGPAPDNGIPNTGRRGRARSFRRRNGAYGVFLSTVIDFMIVAFVIFLLVRQMNRLKKEAPAAAPTTKDCPQCAMSIPIAAKRCGHCTATL